MNTGKFHTSELNSFWEGVRLTGRTKCACGREIWAASYLDHMHFCIRVTLRTHTPDQKYMVIPEAPSNVDVAKETLDIEQIIFDVDLSYGLDFMTLFQMHLQNMLVQLHNKCIETASDRIEKRSLPCVDELENLDVYKRVWDTPTHNIDAAAHHVESNIRAKAFVMQAKKKPTKYKLGRLGRDNEKETR